MSHKMNSQDCREEYTIETIYNNEAEIQINFKFDFGSKIRVCLMNRTHADPTVHIAKPGIGNNFSTSVKWSGSFTPTRRNMKKEIRYMLDHHNCSLGEYKDNNWREQAFIQAVYDATQLLIKNNFALMSSTWKFMNGYEGL